MIQTMPVFWLFLKRHAVVYKQKFSQFLINALIPPIAASFAQAYLQANTYFGAEQSTYMATLFLAGNSIIIMLSLTFDTTIDLLFDFEHERFVDYQITLLNPRLIVLERIVFSALFTTMMVLPFYPICKLLLHGYMDTSATSWPLLFCMIFFSCLCLAAYCQCAICIMRGPQDIMPFWTRINVFLIILGGLFVPLYTIQKASYWLGIALYINPIMYITEGLRQSMLGGPQFLPVWICIPALLGFTTIFTALACYYFKKRVDHI